MLGYRYYTLVDGFGVQLCCCSRLRGSNRQYPSVGCSGVIEYERRENQDCENKGYTANLDV